MKESSQALNDDNDIVGLESKESDESEAPLQTSFQLMSTYLATAPTLIEQRAQFPVFPQPKDLAECRSISTQLNELLESLEDIPSSSITLKADSLEVTNLVEILFLFPQHYPLYYCRVENLKKILNKFSPATFLIPAVKDQLISMIDRMWIRAKNRGITEAAELNFRYFTFLFLRFMHPHYPANPCVFQAGKAKDYLAKHNFIIANFFDLDTFENRRINCLPGEQPHRLVDDFLNQWLPQNIDPNQVIARNNWIYYLIALNKRRNDYFIDTTLTGRLLFLFCHVYFNPTPLSKYGISEDKQASPQEVKNNALRNIKILINDALSTWGSFHMDNTTSRLSIGDYFFSPPEKGVIVVCSVAPIKRLLLSLKYAPFGLIEQLYSLAYTEEAFDNQLKPADAIFYSQLRSTLLIFLCSSYHSQDFYNFQLENLPDADSYFSVRKCIARSIGPDTPTDIRVNNVTLNQALVLEALVYLQQVAKIRKAESQDRIWGYPVSDYLFRQTIADVISKPTEESLGFIQAIEDSRALKSGWFRQNFQDALGVVKRNLIQYLNAVNAQQDVTPHNDVPISNLVTASHHKLLGSQPKRIYENCAKDAKHLANLLPALGAAHFTYWDIGKDFCDKINILVTQGTKAELLGYIRGMEHSKVLEKYASQEFLEVLSAIKTGLLEGPTAIDTALLSH